MKTFSQNLVTLRKAAGFSQKDFANMLNIPVTTLSGYELSDREPKFDMLVKMAAMLNVSVDTLLHDTTEQKFNFPQRDDFMSALQIKLAGDTVIVKIPREKLKQMILTMQLAADFLNHTSSIIVEKGDVDVEQKYLLKWYDTKGEKSNE